MKRGFDSSASLGDTQRQWTIFVALFCSRGMQLQLARLFFAAQGMALQCNCKSKGSRCPVPSLFSQVSLFEQTAAATSGQALRRVLWLQSRSSEDWLVRRANFCKSIAVMSMVGYALGLGDRHPSNLLLMRDSGRVAHIDFSDCFEVAAHRKKYPEKVPFRLVSYPFQRVEGSHWR